MVTDEERREVAERLRECTEGQSPLAKYPTEVLYIAVGLPMTYEVEGALLELLADLIQPEEPEEERTCCMQETSWDDGQCTWGCKCSACGHRFEYETGKHWQYCPGCGAKVVAE